MSNYLAVATATETIAQIIRDAITPVIPGAEVTTDRPERASKDAQARVNVYLYQVAPNAALRNADLPMRGANGQLENRPRTAMDLFYLINFYGRDEQLVAQQLLGLAAAALHLHARLSRQDILRAIRAAPGGFLNDSNLAEQTESLNIFPHALNLEELSKLWSVMFQVPYTLSASYQCSVVIIDGPPAPEALPVRSISPAVAPGRGPVIQGVSAAQDGAAIVVGGDVVIRGTGLRGGAPTTVVVGDVVLTPAPADVSDAQVTVALTDTRLRPGPASLAVAVGSAVSAPVSFVVAPVVTGVRFRAGAGQQAPTLRVALDPPIPSVTPVTVLLNAVRGEAGQPPAAYAFDAPQPPSSEVPRRVSSVTLPIPGVAAGTYLVRVRINGAESPLGSKTPGGPFVSPRVTVK